MSTKFTDLPKEEQEKIGEAIEDLLNAVVYSFGSWKKSTLENKKLLQRNYQHVGKIINCHLVIENLINNALIAHYKYSEEMLADARLSFSQKLKLLPAKGKLYRIVIPGIEQLNTIRNKIAHNLDFEIEKAKTDKIDLYMQLVKMGDPKKVSVEKKIEEFTNICIAAFSTNSKEVKKHWDLFRKKHPVFYKKIIKLFEDFENFPGKI